MKSLLLLLSLTVPMLSAVPYAHDLRCEYHARPLAIGTTHPRFSWKLVATDPAARGLRQSAYEIQVAGAEKGFDEKALWSSGKVASAATDQIEYAGTPLASRARAQWRGIQDRPRHP